MQGLLTRSGTNYFQTKVVTEFAFLTLRRGELAN